VLRPQGDLAVHYDHPLGSTSPGAPPHSVSPAVSPSLRHLEWQQRERNIDARLPGADWAGRRVHTPSRVPQRWGTIRRGSSTYLLRRRLAQTRMPNCTHTFAAHKWSPEVNEFGLPAMRHAARLASIGDHACFDPHKDIVVPSWRAPRSIAGSPFLDYPVEGVRWVSTALPYPPATRGATVYAPDGRSSAF
jgi:hypothetical protein